MPLSARQEYNLWHIMTGDIPAAAVIDWAGMTSLDRMEQQEALSRAPYTTVRQRVLGSQSAYFEPQNEMIHSLPGDISQKIDKQRLIINSFYNSMHEGMWEGAKALAEDYKDEFPGLKKIYETEYAKAHPKTLAEKYYEGSTNRRKESTVNNVYDTIIKKQQGTDPLLSYWAELKAKNLEDKFKQLLLYGFIEDAAYQCVAFSKGFARMLEAGISTSGYGSGYEAAGSVANKSMGVFHQENYSKGMKVPAGTLLSNLAPTGTYGHVFAVLKDIGDYVIAVEQAGELAEGSKEYDPEAGSGPKAQGFKWHSNSSGYWYNDNRRYRSYYNTDKKTHMLTMMPGITLIPKSYLEDGRKISMAVPDDISSLAVEKMTEGLGLDSLSNPEAVEKFNETWWKSLGGR